MNSSKTAELTLTTFLTLDGVMQAPGGPTEDPSGDFQFGGWVIPHADGDMGATMVDIFSKASAFLLGRRTYDIFAGHWPKVTDPNDPIAAKLNALPKFVASRTRTGFSWAGTTLVADVEKGVDELKRRFTGEIQVHGSGGLAQTLLSLDLVDEYRLLTFPVVLGSGRRFFGPGCVPATLKLISSRSTGTGIVISIYRRAGKFRTGNVVLKADGSYEMVS